MQSAVTFFEEYCCPYCGNDRLKILRSEQSVISLEKGEVVDAEMVNFSQKLLCNKCDTIFFKYFDNGKHIIPMPVGRQFLIDKLRPRIKRYNMFTGEEIEIGE